MAGGTAVAYAYYGTGRRVARTVNGQTWQYLYGSLGNPFRLTATKEPDGTLTSYYYDDGGRLYAFERGGTRYYAACDQVGTPKVVTDAAGNVVRVLEYDSFGCLVSDSNPTFYLPVGFAGGLADADTGLVRFGFRDYDPATGRWTAKDPIFFAGGQANLYAYCGSDSVNSKDSWGLYPGQRPPALPGYDPLWPQGQWPNGRGWVQSPDGQTWTEHPEDRGHWRHWDTKVDGEKVMWPDNAKKRYPNQPKCNKDQSDSDPSGDEPEWQPANQSSSSSNNRNDITISPVAVVTLLLTILLFRRPVLI
jgi:RHS repeat-associated protein